MAIQFRSGSYEDYDASKMKTAEPAVVLSGDPVTADGKSVRVSFGPGDDKRLLTQDDADTINTALNSKAPKESPSFTGTPSAPTAPEGTSTTQLATTQFVRNELNGYSVARITNAEIDAIVSS